MQVTDYKWYDKRFAKWRTGYYMDEFLSLNLMGIPSYLDKSWDVVGIISGHSKVRIGKMLPGKTNVLMSDGSWKKVEDININDKIISPAIDGKTTSIANVFEKIGHKNLNMCEVRRSSDNKLLYTCCEDHNVPVRTLWTKTSRDKKTEYVWEDEIYSAGDLANKNEQWFKNHTPKIITSPIITSFDKERDYKVNPYIVGLYLGDGHKENKNCVSITNPDKNILQWLKDNGFYKYIRNKRACPTIAITTKYSEIAECGNGSYNKKIPMAVFSSSYEYRKRLLEGLIDTDSYINPKGFVVYTTASEQLAKDVRELVKTLGCRANIEISYKGCQSFKKDEKRKYYNVNINLGQLSRELNLLRTERANRLKNLDLNNVRNKESQYEGIIVKRIDEKMDGYCINVDSESHLYIIDDYVVTHNSTFAQQVGYYVAWMLAGGKMVHDKVQDRWIVGTAPKKKINFSLDNLVFSPKDLMKKASHLYEKYGRNQVIIYDEGRAGLDSAAAMTAINKAMQDFFQECGQYGHVILIVLPNFFKLHEDYATSRSLFLIDVYANEKLERGFFNFYNERQKEWLYFLGKKKIGNAIKYIGVRPSFSGRFSSFSPLDKKEYEAAKAQALKDKQVTVKEKSWKRQRDAAIFLVYKNSGWSLDTVSKELSLILGEPVSESAMQYAIENITHKKLGEKEDG